MLFNTIEFFIFFVIFLSAIVIIKNRNYQHLLILAASYFFFYYSSNYIISLLIASTILDYYVGKAIYNSKTIRKKKFLLIVSLSGNLGLLGFFKYANFGIDQFNNLAHLFGSTNNIPFIDIILPIGISFYTFQTISYTVDIYRKKLIPCNSFKEFALFVSFFPQLVAGPILRASEFLPQLREKAENYDFHENLRRIVIHNQNLKLGITIMAFGFFKKMFFADNIAPLVNDIFASPNGSESFTIILGAIAFGIQIYGDFSGYSDIAIGAALILGFKIPRNFNKPYFARSPSDFWRKWHISLSTWLRDYLYIPLGGNKKSKSRTYLNLGIVMFLGGLWHGASWNFVIWGLLHGSYLAIHRLLIEKFPRLSNNLFFKSKVGTIISIFVTQYFVFLAWIAFRVKDYDDVMYSIRKYIFLDFAYENTFLIISEHKIEFFILVLFFVLHFIHYYKIPNLIEKISNLKLEYWFIFLLIIMITIFFFYDGNSNDFIYFQF
jgi:D-alanyl-lipoteichoic acid acyltransferase DltB (MBOAT superfamily)